MEECPPGYYSTDQMLHCQISPAGKYAPVTTAEPQDCPTGYISDVGQTACTKCPPGHRCLDQTSRHVSLCKPGSYYDGSAGECVDCPAGHYCPISIPGYRQSSNAGGTAEGPVPCPAGTYAPEGSYECQICPPGWDCSFDTSQATKGSVIQVADASTGGYAEYQLGGSATVSPCPANHECPFGETVVRCPMFHYSNERDGYCQPCPGGSDCQDWSLDYKSTSNLHQHSGTSAVTGAPVTCLAGYYA